VTDKPTRSHNSRLSGGNDDDDDDDDCDGCETLTDAQAVACCSSSELFIVTFFVSVFVRLRLCFICLYVCLKSRYVVDILFHTNDK